MRIYFIIVDEPFFHPSFLEEIINQEKENIVGITILPNKSPKASFIQYLKRQYDFWGTKGFILLSFKIILYKFLDFFSKIYKSKKFFSVASVAQRHNLPLYRAENVNYKKHLDYLKDKNIDLIVSACGQVFKKELLAIPKIGIINRHSSLLPKYGGLWPIFWALLHNEKSLGVSVHRMTEKIDSGDIIYQKSFDVSDADTLESAYRKSFEISPLVVLKAIEKIKNNNYQNNIKFKKSKFSYFLFPTKKDIENFRKKRKMI